MPTLNYEKALQMAADVVEANAVAGKRDKADPRTMDSFFVRYERGADERVTLNVRMKLVNGVRPMRFTLEVETSFGSTHRDLASTRKFVQLLQEVVEVGEKVEAALEGFTFTEEKV